MSKKAIIGLILLGIFLFLWFEVRTAVIYSVCSKQAKNNFNENWEDIISKILKETKSENFVKVVDEFYQFYFVRCLNKYGINP